LDILDIAIPLRALTQDDGTAPLSIYMARGEERSTHHIQADLMFGTSLLELFQVLAGVVPEVAPMIRPATDVVHAVSLEEPEALIVRGPALAAEDETSRLTDTLYLGSGRSSETH
jgi:hypothetical protein